MVLDTQLGSVRHACIEIFAGRQRHAWPPTVRTWPAWSSLYSAAIVTLGDDVLPDMEAAVDWLRGFVEAIEAAESGIGDEDS